MRSKILVVRGNLKGSKAVLSRNELLNLDPQDPKIIFYSNTSKLVMDILLNDIYPTSYLPEEALKALR